MLGDPSHSNLPARPAAVSAARPIRQIYAERRTAGRPVVSVEFFPPRTPDGERALFDRTLPALMDIRPDFCSVTYGAGGSTRDKTLEVAARVQREFGLTAMAHLTCIGTSREEVHGFLVEAEARGIQNILALRGDPPRGVPDFDPPANGFTYSYQLIDFIRQRGGFSIGTAGFPEGHIACREGKHADWQRLKLKVNHGADFVLTQLFFDNADYFAFAEYVSRTLELGVPLTPGILPMLNGEQVKRFTALCGARLPDPLATRLSELGDDHEAVARFGIDYATRQSEALLAGGAPGLHIYTLNRPEATIEIVRRLGLR